MKLYLMRHGVTEESPDTETDFYRSLTMRGRKRVRQVGRALRENWLIPEMIVASPLVRALQTAEIIAASLDPDEPLEVRRELAPGGDLVSLIKELVASDLESVLLVGHEPALSEFVSTVMGSDAWGGMFTKAMILALRIEPQGKVKALFRLDPKRLEPTPI